MTDIESLVRETKEAVVRVETKVDFLLMAKDDQELRIRSLEKWRWGVPGSAIAAVLAIFVG